MAHTLQAEQRGFNRLILWFMRNVFTPLLPIPVVRIVDHFFIPHYPGHGLRDEVILIYAFLLPLLYLEEMDRPIAKLAMGLSSMMGLLLFVIAHLLEHKESNSDAGSAAPVHKAGAFLCVSYIGLALVYEAYKSFKKPDRSVQ